MKHSQKYLKHILIAVVLKKNDGEDYFIQLLKQILSVSQSLDIRILIFNNSGNKISVLKNLNLFIKTSYQTIIIDWDEIKNKFEYGLVNLEGIYLSATNAQIIVNKAFLLKVLQLFLYENSERNEIICILQDRRMFNIKLLISFLMRSSISYNGTISNIVFFMKNNKYLISIVYSEKKYLLAEPQVFNFNTEFIENHYDYLAYLSPSLNFKINKEYPKVQSDILVSGLENIKIQRSLVITFIESLKLTSYESFESFLHIFESKLSNSKILHDYYNRKINPELVRNIWKKSNEDLYTNVFRKRNMVYRRLIAECYGLNLNDLKTIGHGTEGYICTEGEWVYKMLYKPLCDEYPLQKVIKLSSISDLIYPIQINKIDSTHVIRYKYEDSKIYAGGYKNEIVNFLKGCRESSLLFWDFKKANFRVTRHGLKLIDYGVSFEEFNELIFRQSCLKAYLMFNFHWLNSWDFKTIAKQIDHNIFKKKYFGKNIYRDYEKENFLDILFETKT
jgi:hypothetical protein